MLTTFSAILSSPTSEYAVFTCDPEPPEARVFFASPRPPEACARSLGEGCGRGRAPLTLSLDLVFAGREPPEASARSLGEGCEGGGVPPPPRGSRERESFAGPKPPEACAGALCEGCERGGVPLPPRHGSTAGGERRHPRRMIRKGSVTPTPRAGLGSVAAPRMRTWLADFCGFQTAGGQRAHPR
ncbi:hypothetical protein K523DRAFT_422359 [Schizophyllum commune Tattone D]|nr:hypothetical protein K523DRAFT_422359 [Schizophyllum commune Tattone D]